MCTYVLLFNCLFKSIYIYNKTVKQVCLYIEYIYEKRRFLKFLTVCLYTLISGTTERIWMKLFTFERAKRIWKYCNREKNRCRDFDGDRFRIDNRVRKSEKKKQKCMYVCMSVRPYVCFPLSALEPKRLNQIGFNFVFGLIL